MAKLTVKNLNRFLLFKLPAAYFAGVRVKSLNAEQAISTVKFKWINQNPFKSMFWAVQGMAAELPTGLLVMNGVRESGKAISMLVTHQTGTFSKKALGRIHFTCNDGHLVLQAIEKTLKTKEGETVLLTSTGRDQDGDIVSTFTFEWSVRVK